MSAPNDHHAHADGEPHPLVGHLVPIRTLVLTGLALIFLTVVTVAVRYVDVGEFNIVIALAVAVVKAMLVVLVFMHLLWDRPFNSLVLLGSIVFVVLLVGIAMTDTHMYRPSLYNGNAKTVQETLDSDAPYAPIAEDVTTGPIGS
ncbi:MAG: cytochrome C oxidase subunit IV family protein [Planctomycetota bacterium]|jgi:cytochrome c oxidase subunit 4